MATTAESPARKAYMSKEQLEAYLADLRNNRPRRPTSGRPMSTAARSRWSTVHSSTSLPSMTQPDLGEAINKGPPRLVGPANTPGLTRRESKLIRKHSTTRHARSNTVGSIRNFAGLRSGSRDGGFGSDGQDDVAVEDDDGAGNYSSTSVLSRPSFRRPKRDSAGSGLRGLAGLVGTRPTTASSRSSASSGHSETRNMVEGGYTTAAATTGQTSRPTSPARMPPVHPPKPEDAPMIEKELALHFKSLGMQDIPPVAPLNINKATVAEGDARLQTVGRQTEQGETKDSFLSRERSSTLPGRPDQGPLYLPRQAYVEPWKHEPTQHNKVQYTTNPDPFPSPPTSENEREEETEILKELKRRPLPRVSGPRGMTPPDDAPTRRNTTKYGSQMQSSKPLVIGTVTSTDQTPVQRVTRTNTAPSGPKGPRETMGGRVGGPRPTPQAQSGNIASSRPPAQPVSASTPAVPTINVPGSNRPLPTVNVTITPPVPTINAPSSSKPSIPSINVSNTPSIPSISVSNSNPPPIPTISLPDDTPPSIPKISLPDDNPPSIPSISLPDDPSSSYDAGSSARPLPRPRPSPTVTSNSSFRSSTARTTATCNHCREPIQGRIVSAASLRFHPSCFRCAHCATSLEHVGFYPEPNEARKTRLASNPDPSSASPGIRFYCHLDFHELFSPRCKSCKTPIEGEVVVACGSTWHQGHFFCAECGDPFDKSSRFVEKDGYAWCVGCYAKRFSGKCKKCKKPVLETVVKALGAEWHEECFCCTECSGKFEDGRFFVRNDAGREVPVCVKCEERRLKM